MPKLQNEEVLLTFTEIPKGEKKQTSLCSDCDIRVVSILVERIDIEKEENRFLLLCEECADILKSQSDSQN